MIITSKVNMDLMQQPWMAAINAVQDDRYSRNLELSLYTGELPWNIPENAGVLIRYSKSDGTGGEYDTLPEGTTAWFAEGNVLTVALAPQVLTAAGPVNLSVVLIQEQKQLSTFSVLIHVHPTVRPEIGESVNYFHVTSYLPAPVLAKSGQYFRIAAVDGQGKVTAVEAVDLEVESSGGNMNLTAAQIAALDNMFKVCAFTRADVSAEYNAFKAVFGIEDSGEDVHTHAYTSSVTTAATCTTSGMRTYSCSCGESYSEEIPATGHNYVDGVCTACGATDPTYSPDVTLSSISVVYSGGDVEVGTAVTDLTGIVVTAHYSDGTSETVTGYTLSGTIAEGSNTITVTYGGKTTVFTVTGVAESGGEETGVSNETTWTSGVAYTFEPISGSYPDKSSGVIKDYNNWERSPYLYCAGASTLRGVVKYQSSVLGGTNDNAFYDADKNYVAPVQTFTFNALNNAEVGTYFDIPIPANAAYFIVSGGNKLLSGNNNSNYEPFIEYVPYE